MVWLPPDRMPAVPTLSFRWWLLVATVVVPTTLLAARVHPDPVVMAIHRLTPEGHISSLVPGPMHGFVTAMVDGVPLYVSTNGRFVIQGHIYDMARGIDLSALRVDQARMRRLDSLPRSDFITLAPPHPKYRVVAFVDTDCGYCQALVNGLSAYMAQGIAFDFLAFPRNGIGSPSYDDAERIWCARDRAKIFRDAFAGEDPPAATCVNPVAKEFALATAMGLVGTPTLIAPDGTVLPGLMSPVALRQRLDHLATADTAAGIH